MRRIGIAFFCLVMLCCAPFYGLAAGKQGAALHGVKQEQPSKGMAYVGNAKTGKYHNASCRHFTCKNCVIRLNSPAEARQKGFVACKVCGG